MILDILIILILVAGFFFLFHLLNKGIEKKLSVFTESLKGDQSLTILSQNIEGLRSRVDKTSEVMGAVARELGSMQEIGRDMKKLQDFFKTPKLRGNIGEQVLKDLLEQILPTDVLRFQHKFQDGQMVDAVVKTSQGIVPIDSKFPLTSFKERDIKKHINDIARKYILPGEGTVDFAVMYVPSETIYYELLTKYQGLLELGYSKKVYIVSPNNFYYFLKVIMIGLEGGKIEEASRFILRGLKSIEQESRKLEEEFSVMNRHIGNAKNASDRTLSQFQRLQSKIDNVSTHKLENNNSIESD